MKKNEQIEKRTVLERVSKSQNVAGRESQKTIRSTRSRSSKAQLSTDAKERLVILKFAEQTGVSAACRQHGISRPTLYKWKVRYTELGVAGLENLPPIAKRHPATTSAEVEAHIVRLSREHPDYGSQKIQNELEKRGIQISRATVEKIRQRHGLKRQHIKKARGSVGKENSAINAEDIRPTAPSIPTSTYPGQLLSQTVIHLGRFKPIGHVFLHTIIDTYSSMAWVALSIDHNKGRRSNKELARNVVVEALLEEVVGWYEVRGLRVASILTDRGRDFCGVPLGRKGDRRYNQSLHPYSILLKRLGIQHQTHDLKRPQTHPAFERLRRVLRERLLDAELSEPIAETDVQVTSLTSATSESRRLAARAGGRAISLWDDEPRGNVQPAPKAMPMTVVRDYKRRIDDEPHELGANVRHYKLLQELEGKIQRWVTKYNNQLKKPHATAPNLGRTPKQMFDDYMLSLANQAEAPPSEAR